MCHNRISTITGGMDIPAVLFMNSNKSEQNARKIVAEDRLACCYVGIAWKHEVIVNKGANRDIDREAVNILVSLLVTRQCEVFVVEKLSDLTNDASDLEEFMRDAAQIGGCFYETIFTVLLQLPCDRPDSEKDSPAWDGMVAVDVDGEQLF